MVAMVMWVLLHTVFYDHTDHPDKRREGGREEEQREGGKRRKVTTRNRNIKAYTWSDISLTWRIEG